MSEGAKPRRRYDSRRRQAQAAQTRHDILIAAHEPFLQRGYAGTTLASIATAAGVVVETIYRAYGSKAGLFKAVVEAAVAGGAARAERAARRAAGHPGRHRRDRPATPARAVRSHSARHPRQGGTAAARPRRGGRGRARACRGVQAAGSPTARRHGPLRPTARRPRRPAARPPGPGRPRRAVDAQRPRRPRPARHPARLVPRALPRLARRHPRPGAAARQPTQPHRDGWFERLTSRRPWLRRSTVRITRPYSQTPDVTGTREAL